jgi:hypothetical protein
MKRFLIFLLIISVLVSFGCKKVKDATIETKTVTKEYTKGVAAVPGKARTVAALAEIRHAINMYRVEKGKYPERLSDLPLKVTNPEHFEYNPKTGKIKSKYYPKL